LSQFFNLSSLTAVFDPQVMDDLLKLGTAFLRFRKLAPNRPGRFCWDCEPKSHTQLRVGFSAKPSCVDRTGPEKPMHQFIAAAVHRRKPGSPKTEGWLNNDAKVARDFFAPSESIFCFVMSGHFGSGIFLV
jgi:hypothetical protein